MWEEYRERVGSFGKALLSLAFKGCDGINILGFNAPKWCIANFATIAAGDVSICDKPIHGACKYILEDSKDKVLVVFCLLMAWFKKQKN
jgi:long-subunit acyl-CoA synthetase (AMP-forming)